MCAAQVSASLESRLDNLARPKVNFLKYKDRPSVYWQDKPKMSSICGLTARQEELAKHKSVSNMYIEDRASPIWPVSSRALQAVPSLRVEKLAEPKSVSQHWMEDRSVYTTVTEGAKIASASARIIELARPKNCANNEIPNTPKSYLNEDEDKESLRSNKSVTASARTEALADFFQHLRRNTPSTNMIFLFYGMFLQLHFIFKHQTESVSLQNQKFANISSRDMTPTAFLLQLRMLRPLHV
uniref:Testicular haploid expressed protein n=1 Tax=Pyxicephalus adspersus TaxID=30357 RepID=A0AAV3ALR9_PYXAD|nr:TPA: hypothetical protein GDO54_008748 [Pyxicephalus adspersus]